MAETFATFAPKDRSLIFVNSGQICVFEMPTSFDGDLVLRVIKRPNFRERMPFKKCPHERFYLGANDDSDSNFKSLHSLRDIEFEVPDIGISQDITLKYFSRHVNGIFTLSFWPDDMRYSVIEYICSFYDDHDPLLRSIFSVANSRWTPLLGSEFNPMKFFLDKAKTDVSNMTKFMLCWEHCLQMAPSTRNTLFLGPVAVCIPTLLDSKLPHSKLAKATLHRMAFIPALSRSLIMKHHVLIHPPELRINFWKPNSRPLFKCEEPILQLETLGTREPVAIPGNDTFLHDVFVATFDMIWCDTGRAALVTTTTNPKGTSPSLAYWIKMSLFVALFKINPWKKHKVTCHEFSLEALDNPAISALIAYKWSTIGFVAWITRFTFQCVYYLLIIKTVFIQVYSPVDGSLPALFGIIATMASTFLILEVSQLLHNPKRYIDSLLYNLVDIAAFALPLGGCINQFHFGSTPNENTGENTRGPNSWIFSFSVLCIALHLLFELRVNRAVCQFVTIIVQIFSRIRIFFRIFLGGIFAFNIALLHLLRGCVQNPCIPPSTNFPGNFYQSFSATIFFVGGKYDPVSDEFSENTNPNWAFHTMMIFYLFFTVILMLNVLIALINLAFADGDTTWQLVWLQNRLWYVESAENMSYHIPGLRENYDIFPKEIYYCLSDAQVQQYKTRWAKADDLSRTTEVKQDSEKDSKATGKEDEKNAELLRQVLEELAQMRKANSHGPKQRTRTGAPSFRVNRQRRKVTATEPEMSDRRKGKTRAE